MRILSLFCILSFSWITLSKCQVNQKNDSLNQEKAQIIQIEKNGTNIDFNNFTSFFPLIKTPFKYKGIKPNTLKFKDIPKHISFRYFNLNDSSLIFNDPEYNFDDNIQTDHWKEVLPGAIGKLYFENFIVLIYSLGKYPTYGSVSYESFLYTFSYDGKFIDSLKIRCQKTLESDWLDIAFLKDGTFKLFNYELNTSNINQETHQMIDPNKGYTILEISDYLFTNNGVLKQTNNYKSILLKEIVPFYREFNPNSDDPMNNY